MIILKTESQLKSFIHRHSCKSIDDDDRQFYWELLMEKKSSNIILGQSNGVMNPMNILKLSHYTSREGKARDRNPNRYRGY
jgi:hypothetical protein